jgi:sarcosine oxidase subunit gamma
VSVPESTPAFASCGVALAGCATDIIEIAAFRNGAPAVRELAARRAWALPAHGRLMRGAQGLALCVRPGRWLLLSPPAAAGAAAAGWQSECAGMAAALDLSSALVALHLAGPAIRAMLARGCRIDLDPLSFPVGSAAATVIAQVTVLLAALTSGMLLLTPATTAAHLREWLVSTARPFGLDAAHGATVEIFSGELIA